MTQQQPEPGGQPGLFPDEFTAAHEREAAETRAAWLTDAETALLRLLAAGDPFDAHTITEQLGRDAPERGMMTRLLRDAARAGRLARVGYRPSRRPTTGSVAAIWQATTAGRADAQARTRAAPAPAADPPPAERRPRPEPPARFERPA